MVAIRNFSVAVLRDVVRPECRDAKTSECETSFCFDTISALHFSKRDREFFLFSLVYT